MRATPSLAAGLALAAACGSPAEPRWIRLADLAGESPLLLAATGEPVEAGERASLRLPLSGEGWTEVGAGTGLWRRALPPALAGRRARNEDPPRLVLEDGTRVRFVSMESVVPALADEDGGEAFAIWSDALLLRADRPAPPDGVLHYDRLPEDPLAEAGRFRVGSVAGVGLDVLPGEALELTVDLPPESSLRFATLAASLAPDAESEPAFPRFRIELDGEPRFAERHPSDAAGRCAWRAIDLPREGRRDARLRFTVEGAPAGTAFVAPTIGPREIGRPGDRPWSDPRPDLVVVVADTFRADNLAAWGAEVALAPELDALAASALRFPRAWANSPWTLPSHASLFSGLHPHQHGAVDGRFVLGRGAETIAERLRAGGYRTVAVTDGGYVSPTFGLAQGFEVFRSRYVRGRELWDATERRVEELASADDGRPLFLFVQSYHVHAPYREPKGALEPAVAARYPVRGGWQEFGPCWADWLAEDPRRARYAAEGGEDLLRWAEHLYRRGVPELSRGIGRLVGGLERDGILGGGVLLFTSDHGESFGENGRVFHGSGVYEEQVRIPLFLRGPGLEPGAVDHAVTLVDVPRTLAELAGVEPAPSWEGNSLVSLDRARPAFAFQCSAIHADPRIALVDGRHKLLLDGPLDDPRVSAAFDLADDPLERRDLAGAGWIEEVFGRRRERLLAIVEPVVPAGEARPDAAERKLLEQLGYLDE